MGSSMSVVRYEQEGRLVVITMNRPDKLNALNRPMVEGLEEAFDRFRDDDTAWISILTGEGRAFCAGRDLGERVTKSDGGKPRRISTACNEDDEADDRRGQRAVHGARLRLALSTDVIFASESAWFGWPQVKRGIGSVSGPSLLTRIVPLNIALEYLYTGKRLDSATALRWGIVNRVAPDGGVVAMAKEFAAEVLENAPLAVRAMKEASLASQYIDASTAADRCHEVADRLNTTDDFTEGLLAFKEKRVPVWQAR